MLLNKFSSRKLVPVELIMSTIKTYHCNNFGKLGLSLTKDLFMLSKVLDFDLNYIWIFKGDIKSLFQRKKVLVAMLSLRNWKRS